MTIDESISLLKQYIDYNNPDVPDFYTMEEACEVVINALEQQLTDAVSRQAAIDAIEDDARCGVYSHFASYDDAQAFKNYIKDLPSVSAQPKMGMWIEHFDESGKWYECDQCHTDWGGSVNYCPNCGSKMQEVEE